MFDVNYFIGAQFYLQWYVLHLFVSCYFSVLHNTFVVKIVRFLFLIVISISGYFCCLYLDKEMSLVLYYILYLDDGYFKFVKFPEL